MGTDTDAQVHGAFGNMLKQFVEEYVSKVLVDSSTKKCMLEVSPGNGATVQQCGAEIKTSTANGVYKTCQQPAKYDEDGKLASVSGKPPIHCGKHRKNKPPRRDKGKMRDVKNATTETTGSDDSNGDGGSKRTHGNETGADHGSVPKMPRVDSSLGKKHVDVLDPGSREVSYTMIETSGSPLIDPPVGVFDETEKVCKAEEVHALINANADLDKTGDDGKTLLYNAASDGNVNIVRALINAGANLDKTGDDGKTPLYIAACRNRTDVVEELIKTNRVDLNKASNPTEETPLHIAAQKGHFRVVKKLIKAGVDLTKTSGIGLTARQVAERGNKGSIVRALDEAEKARDIKESTVLQRKLDELQRKYDESEKENKRLKEKSIRVSEMDAADGLTRLDSGPKKVKKSECEKLNDNLSKNEEVTGPRREDSKITWK